MATSSGELLATNDLLVYVQCQEPDCEFEGDVESWDDDDLQSWGWVCPECEAEHKETYADYQAGLGFDW